MSGLLFPIYNFDEADFAGPSLEGDRRPEYYSSIIELGLLPLRKNQDLSRLM